MARLEYFLAAAGVSVDQGSNRISLFEVLDEVHPVTLPGMLPRMVLICAIEFDEADRDKTFEVSLRGHSPGYPEAFTSKVTVQGNLRLRRIMQGLANIPIEKSGTIEFAAAIDGKDVAHHRVHIHEPVATAYEPLLMDVAKADVEAARKAPVAKKKPS